MKKPIWLFLFVLLLFSALRTEAQNEQSPPPLRRVTLYKHGVGYFERQGPVNGDQQVTFLFDAAQMNDVLKSLVVLDLGKGSERGNISSVTFDSTKPVERRLEEFGLRLDGSNSVGLTSLLGQLKGARIEMRTGSNPLAGTVVGIEKRSVIQGSEKTEVQDLVLVTDGGELRSIPLDQIRGIKLLDPKLREDLEQYLAILQSTIHKNARKLTITANGQAERDLFISYVVEAPVWKTTYRVVLDKKGKPFLQGWALVDNVQDENWENITLSLVSGAPISFIQDLQQPQYKQRPVVGMPEDISLAPHVPPPPLGAIPTYSPTGNGSLEGRIVDPAGSVIPNATVKVTQSGTGAQYTTTTDSDGNFRLRKLSAGVYDIEVASLGFKSYRISNLYLSSGGVARNNMTLEVGGVTETVNVVAEKSSLMSSMAGRASGITADVETQDIGELFEYRIAHPVTIRRNSSALIPILQSMVEGDPVSLYNKNVREQNPMSALYLHNTTGLTLESGPMTIIENDTYAGEALTGRFKPGERRFITYAVDLGCRVSVKEDEKEGKAFLVQIINGEFRLHFKEVKETVYTLNNLTDRGKTVYLEHPFDKEEDWTLVKTVKPVETAESLYRFKVTVPANSTINFSVNEELPETSTTRLSNITTENIEVFVKSNYLTAQMKQAMEAIVDLKAKINLLGRALSVRQAEITSIAKDQERMRENLRALGKSEEEKQLTQRYVGRISQGEDQLERLRQEEKQLIAEQNNLQQQLDDQIRKLAIEHTLR
ncbi:MAG: carboxypeptidase regulatory-like domain-containing protein [Acidobacteria bacterium]|nr:carboxypeptidase regulatory-like domain-containing protein [Acidobacteriota bacterium]